MLASILQPYQNLGLDRIVMAGDDHAVGNEAATALALVFHELATNAVKYGALSVPSVLVRITTRLAGDLVLVDWHERGGPAIALEPVRSGFGTRLSELTLAQQLDGSMERHWTAGGLLVSIAIDRTRLSRSFGD